MATILAGVLLIVLAVVGWYSRDHDRRLLSNAPLLTLASDPPGATVSVDDGKVGTIKPPATFKDPVTDMEFVYVPGGCFQMGYTFGDGEADEKPVHEVCVDGFYLGKYEVTEGEYQKITGSNPSQFKKGDRFPVEMVSWDDTQSFIKVLKVKSGKIFRLPTEAEWEYAARSGGKDEKYSGSDNPDRVAWYSDNSGKTKHKVGTKSANGLGLYGMSGNVWEWCNDRYGWQYYGSSPRQNPAGSSDGNFRVYRGGCRADSSWGVRSAVRSGDSLDNLGHGGLGFRLLLQASGAPSR